MDRDRSLFVYGDPAYCGSRVVMGAYKRPPGAQLTPEKALFNREMSACRISVEHDLLTFGIGGCEMPFTTSVE